MSNRIPPYEMARSTCQAFQSDRICVDVKAAEVFAKELDVEMVKKAGASLAFDVNLTGPSCSFDSVEEEAAFILFFHALDFGSGWRLQLHKHHDKGAFLTIKPGVENFYKAHRKLSSSELMNATKEEVATAFGLQGNAEVDDLVQLLHQVIVELGRNTQEDGTLSAYIGKKLKGVSKETPAGDLVWDLVETFPDTFDDWYIVNGQKVCFFKKAQLVVGEMFHRFRSEDKRFDFVDGNRLTAYIDNVICASMRYKKVIVPCEELMERIESCTELAKGSEDEVALRAAAMVGIEQVVGIVALSSIELGNYLWGGLGKAPEVRKFQRHATKTVFY
jgi:hypothetical protein